MAANEGHKKTKRQSSKSIFKRKSQSKNHKSIYALGIWIKKWVYNLKSQNKWSISEARKIKFGMLTNFQLVTLTTPHSTLHPPLPPIHLTFLIGAEDWDKVFMSDQQDTQSSQSLKIGSNQHLQDLWRKSAIIVFGMS